MFCRVLLCLRGVIAQAVAKRSGKGIMHVQEHAGAGLLIITLGELEDECFLRVGVLRDMLEVKRGILSLCCLNEEFFFGEDQDEGWLDNRGIKFGGVLEVGSVFFPEFKTVVLSAWGGFAVFFKGLGRVVGCVGGDAGKGSEEARTYCEDSFCRYFHREAP